MILLGRILLIQILGARDMNCKRCGSDNCVVINEVHTSGKDYDAGKGCCGAILFGPLGILCGACGEERTIKNVHYWVCNNCGFKFRV